MFPHFFPACLWFGVILLPWIEELSFRGGEMAQWAETFPRTKTSFGPPVPTGGKKISLVHSVPSNRRTQRSQGQPVHLDNHRAPGSVRNSAAKVKVINGCYINPFP